MVDLERVTEKLSNAISAASFLKHPRTPPGASALDYQTADSEHLMKRLRAGQSDEVLMNELAAAFPLFSFFLFFFFCDLITTISLVVCLYLHSNAY